MIEEVVKSSNATIPLQDEQFLVVVDLLVFRPELDLQVMLSLPLTGSYPFYCEGEIIPLWVSKVCLIRSVGAGSSRGG